MLRILSLCGSLRAGSSNAAALAAARALAPPDVRFAPYDGLGGLPHFNPDLEDAALPEPARRFREAVAQADGVLICSPEYAHGMPGAFKNALDWLVGGVEMNGKPVAVINISPRAVHAHEQTLEVLRMIAADVGEYSSILAPVPAGPVTEASLLADEAFSGKLAAGLAAFVDVVRAVVDTRAGEGGEAARIKPSEG
ncbi:MAG: NAD(P)H-dependent oxidoreductase [Caulobacteraceae bacterium]|nr:NAD(P)H-dependent oxidoreductase [Caulobacteraceae bacterium]